MLFPPVLSDGPMFCLPLGLAMLGGCAWLGTMVHIDFFDIFLCNVNDQNSVEPCDALLRRVVMNFASGLLVEGPRFCVLPGVMV